MSLIKTWVANDADEPIVPIEDQAMQQLRNIAKMPFVFRHVAAMPDVHWGMGASSASSDTILRRTGAASASFGIASHHSRWPASADRTTASGRGSVTSPRSS